MEKFIVKISKQAQVSTEGDKQYITNQGWQPLSGIAHNSYAAAQVEIAEHVATQTSIYQVDKVWLKEV